MEFLISKGTMLQTFPAKYFSDFRQRYVLNGAKNLSVSEDCLQNCSLSQVRVDYCLVEGGGDGVENNTLHPHSPLQLYKEEY